jgi:hypothetical protein
MCVNRCYHVPTHGYVYFSILCVYAGEVDLGCEGYLGRHIRVTWPAVNLDAVDAVLVYALAMESASVSQW